MSFFFLVAFLKFKLTSRSRLASCNNEVVLVGKLLDLDIFCESKMDGLLQYTF